jgi:hypothetical protein
VAQIAGSPAEFLGQRAAQAPEGCLTTVGLVVE